MKRIVMLLLGAIALFVSKSSADAVIDWNLTGITVALRVPLLSRAPGIDLTYMHIAIYDAVNAIDGRYTPFAVTPPNAASWASKEAAVAAAAHRVLVTFYPPQAAYLDSVYAAALSGLPNGEAKTRGIAIGDTVATRFLALRAGDGRTAIVPYTFLPPGPGVYQRTPGEPPQPVFTWLPNFRPFALTTSSQFRAPGPPSLTSVLFARDFNEVKQYGSRDSSLTTPQQREIARFYTENPFAQIARNIRLFATARGLPLADNARLFAQLYVTISDATIGVVESKYYYNFWRPVTAIRAADIDGNPLTQQDTSWFPLCATPFHPEYPAAHGGVDGALAYGLEKFFGTKHIAITYTSTVTNTQHSFTDIRDIPIEVINARVWGGMHYRTSGEDGVSIGRSVAKWVARHYFRPVHGNDHEVDDDDQLESSTNTQRTTTSITEAVGGSAPVLFSLAQNYPNPFNPSTKIAFQVPADGFVSLKVFDVLGREVRTLVNEEMKPGSYETTFDAARLTSGIYFYRLQTGTFTQTKKLLLMK
jgi:type IX secretion system substrate protein